VTIQLRDGLLWFRDAPPTEDKNTDWPNIARQLHPYDATPASSATWVPTDTYPGAVGAWAFTAATGKYLSVPHHAALDPSLTEGFSFGVRAYFTASSDGSGIIVGKMRTFGTASTDLGWSISRSGTSADVQLIVQNGGTNKTVTSSGVTSYSTLFVAFFVWDGPTATATLYIDGALADSSATGFVVAPAAPLFDLFFGRRGFSDATLIDGAVYSAVAYRKALSAAEVAKLSADMVSAHVDELMIGPVWMTCPADVQWDGRSMSFATAIDPGTLAESQAIAAQFAGMSAGDEIPIWWSGDPDVNGVYRLTSDVRVSPEGTWLEHGYMMASLNVERLPRQSARGMVEQTQNRGIRTNTYSLTTANAYTRNTLAGRGRFTSADPSVLVTYGSDLGPYQRHFVALNSGSLTDDIRYTRDPIDTYAGASQIEDLSGSTGRSGVAEVPTGGVVFTVTGTDLMVDSPRDVRLTNGVVRFWPSWNLTRLYCQRWSPEDQWGSTHYITMVMGGNNVTFANTAPRILTNNTLETVVVFGLTGTGIAGWEMAIRLRRGCVVAEMNLAGVSSETLVVTMDSGATSQAIAAAYGACIKSDLPDSLGWFGHLMAPNLVGSASTVGVITLPAGTDVQVGFGVGQDTTSPALEYFCAESFTEWYT